MMFIGLDKLTRSWVETGFKAHPDVLRINGRPVLVGDGIKVAKSGGKMPGVKLLHQESDSNTKPEYIMGHSCQAVAVLGRAMQSFFAIPLCRLIHEGTVFSNRDRRTLLDKMAALIDSIGLEENCYFVADAYYASGRSLKDCWPRDTTSSLRYAKTRWLTRIPPYGGRPRRPWYLSCHCPEITGRPVKKQLEDILSLSVSVAVVFKTGLTR